MKLSLFALAHRWGWGWGQYEPLPEINLVVESQEIHAQQRKLKAVWTMEAEQDLRNFHSMPVDLLTEIMASLH